MTTLRFTADALKDLKRYGTMAARVRAAMTDSAADQVAHSSNVTQLVGAQAKRMRVGDFRVIFEETTDDLLVTKIARCGSVYAQREAALTIQTTILSGEELVTMTRDEYQDLIDARDHEAAMRNVAAGLMPTAAEADLDDYPAAPTPLAFWRKRSGMTQSALGEAFEVSQPDVAQIESGRRVRADIHVYNSIAKCPGVRIEDLIAED